jgi:hypothetical protein
MTPQGVLVLSMIGIVYLVWITRLIRRGKLHISYGVVWIVWIVLGVAIVAIQPLLQLVTTLVGAVYPASALALLAFGLLFAMQVYLLTQITILNQRIVAIAEHLAVTEAGKTSNGTSSTEPN